MEDPASDPGISVEELHAKARQVQRDLAQLVKEINQLLEKIKQIPNDPEAKKK